MYFYWLRDDDVAGVVIYTPSRPQNQHIEQRPRSKETVAGFPIPTSSPLHSFVPITGLNCLFLEISVEIDQDNSSMVDGDNIDEVQILLPEDKIQVCNGKPNIIHHLF